VLREYPGRTIILALQGTDEGFIIPPDGPLRTFDLSEMGLSRFNRFRDLGEEPLFIADSFLPPVLSMPTLVVSSPGRLANRDLNNRLNSYKLRRHYMPIPDEEEVLQLRAACFSHLDVDGVMHRMQLWGPVPRHVLVHTSVDEQKDLWAKADAVKLDTLTALARGHATGNAGVGDEQDAPHRLVHERAAGQDAEPGAPEADVNSSAYYMRGNVVLASPAMMRYLAQRLDDEGNWNAKFLIDASVGIGAFGALRGLKFDELVLSMLEDGTEFESRRLLKGGRRKAQQTAATAAAAAAALAPPVAPAGSVAADDEDAPTRSVPPTPRVVWSFARELQPHRGIPSLLVPRVRNEAGLDALIWDPEAGHHWPLDCTVAEAHGVHAQGVSDAVRALGWVPTVGWPDHGAKKGVQHIKYFWVLPEDRFRHWWTPQPAKDGSDCSVESKEAFANLWQYALCVTAAASTKQVAKTLEQQGVKLPIELVRAGGSGGHASRNHSVGGTGRAAAK